MDEDARQFGASHFLEHLLFKGTDDRGAAEIADAVESVGGDMNAFTTQEYTAFYVRVPDEHLGLALDILADVVWHPAFRPDEVESERRVILEEIGMRDDTPDDLVHELANEALFPDHPLGRAVLGTRDDDRRDVPRRDRGVPRRALSPEQRRGRRGGQPRARRRSPTVSSARMPGRPGARPRPCATTRTAHRGR